MIIDVALLNALYSVRIFGKQTIAKHIAKRLNVTVRTALRRINKLESEKGLKFSIEYSLRALKLKRVAIFMTSNVTDTSIYDVIKIQDVVPFIRSVMTLLPLGIGMVYHVPIDMPEMALNIPSEAIVIVYHELYRNMTDLELYPLRALYDSKILCSSRTLETLKRDIKKRLDNVTFDTNEFRKKENTKFDWVDLNIIKELERNPFIGVEALSKRLSMPISRIKRHMMKHVSRLNRGIRIMRIPVYDQPEIVKLILHLKIKNIRDALAFINSLVKCPLIIGCGLNIDNAEVLVQAIPSVVDVRRVVRFFSDLSRELGFDFRNFFIAVSSRSYTVPFIRDREYTPAVGWRFRERSS